MFAYFFPGRCSEATWWCSYQTTKRRHLIISGRGTEVLLPIFLLFSCCWHLNPFMHSILDDDFSSHTSLRLLLQAAILYFVTTSLLLEVYLKTCTVKRFLDTFLIGRSIRSLFKLVQNIFFQENSLIFFRSNTQCLFPRRNSFWSFFSSCYNLKYFNARQFYGK